LRQLRDGLFDVELKLLLGDVAQLGRIHRLDEVNCAALPRVWMTVMSCWRHNKQDENGRPLTKLDK
jgi:hypothetical protein